MGSGVVWTDFTTRELPGNYPGFGLAVLGCLGEEFDHLVKNWII